MTVSIAAARRALSSTHRKMDRHRESGIGRLAERLLSRLALQASDPETAKCAASAPEAEILLRADLAARRGDGTLEITAAGRAHLTRLAVARLGEGGAGVTLDPFLVQHMGLALAEVETAEGRAALTVDAAESPLAWLARRKGSDGRALIDAIQLQAGERLRSDVTLAQMLPRITANWSSPLARGRRADMGTMNFTEAAIAARQRVEQAFSVLGPEFTGLLLDVCCFLKGLEDVERERRWPARSAKVVLGLGLDCLARHYGYAIKTRGMAHAPIRNWTAPEAVA
jgi:hypothetical protein